MKIIDKFKKKKKHMQAVQPQIVHKEPPICIMRLDLIFHENHIF